MQIPLLHQQIMVQTERLKDLHRSIMLHSTPIPANEIDRMLQEIRNIYSLVLQLNNENAIQLLNEVQLAVAQTNPIVQPAVVSQAASVNGHTTNKEEKEAGSNTEQSIPVPQQPIFKSDENVVEKKRIVSDIHEMFHDAPTLGNSFTDHTTLAEKIAGNDSMKRVSDNLKTPVRDLKAAIGLNEKFQFINQLFKGDAKKYNSTIEELNTSPSAETAMKSVREISDEFNWESHAASAKTFIDIIERRFSV